MIGTLWSRVRNRLYDSGIFSSVRPNEFIISIGNLTWGGTGKTSLTAYLAKFLIDEGHKVGVLSRGYGRLSSGAIVVSDGSQLKSPWEQSGDEPYWLACSIPQAFVVVSESRVEGLEFLSQFQCDVVLLDDAFQHRRVVRDLDLVLIDGTESIADLNVIPFGKLREPLDSLRRANAVIISHAKRANRKTIDSLSKYDIPIFHANYEPANFQYSGKRIAAFCGIASPRHFESLLKENGAELVFFREFPDHHIYSARELEQLQDEALKSGAEAILTTAKDGVKLNHDDFRMPFSVVHAEFVIDEEKEFQEWILKELFVAKRSL